MVVQVDRGQVKSWWRRQVDGKWRGERERAQRGIVGADKERWQETSVGGAG